LPEGRETLELKWAVCSPRQVTLAATSHPHTIDVRLGAFPDALSDLATASVTLIVADPPWNSLTAWADLGPFAARVLVPGGIIVAYIGNRHCFDALDRLREHLTPIRLGFLPVLHRDAWDPEVKCDEGGSFIAVFAKQRFDPPRPWRSVVPAVVDGRWHPYERPLENVQHYVSAFSEPGDLVVDPFLGGGTTAVACAVLHRCFVGCEVDLDAFEATTARIRSLAPSQEFSTER
jgi:site-specific DNA-methyltransferase (adenine-specific)